MPITLLQHRLAAALDAHVNKVLASRASEDEVLRSMADQLGTFQRLLRMSTGEEMAALGMLYDGFYRFTQRLEKLAEGIAQGSIPAPEEDEDQAA